MTDGGGDVDVAVRGVQGRVGRGVGSLGRMREGAARFCVDDVAKTLDTIRKFPTYTAGPDLYTAAASIGPREPMDLIEHSTASDVPVSGCTDSGQ